MILNVKKYLFNKLFFGLRLNILGKPKNNFESKKYLFIKLFCLMPLPPWLAAQIF